MTRIDFKAEADALNDELVARRRDLHRHPEIAFEEVRTAAIVADELRALGMEVQTGVGKTGVVGILEGDKDGVTVLVRADMDALPVHEENETDYASTVDGKMHACGHDGHVSIGLGVAKLLAAHRESIAGRVKFVFQPAEEVANGAKAMIEDGALRDPRPDVSLGLHLWNSLPLGTVGVTPGAAMAGSSVFDVVITGKGAHAANPQHGVDPIVCGALVVSALQSIVSRNLNALDSGVLTVTQFHAGEAYNVIPQNATLKGTFRYYSTEIRDLFVERMQTIIDGVCAAQGCTAEVRFSHPSLPVVNDTGVVEQLRGVLGAYADEIVAERTLGAEDVGEFMTDIPGLYFFVGAKDETADAYYGHHHPRFSFDERALPLGVTLLSAAVASYVIPE